MKQFHREREKKNTKQMELVVGNHTFLTSQCRALKTSYEISNSILIFNDNYANKVFFDSCNDNGNSVKNVTIVS